MTPIPNDPIGKSGLVQTIKRILRVLREQRLIEDPSIKLERTVNGTKISVADKRGSGGGIGNVPRWG